MDSEETAGTQGTADHWETPTTSLPAQCAQRGFAPWIREKHEQLGVRKSLSFLRTLQSR